MTGREPLSERQIEILKLLAAGETGREIAASLFLSYDTVKTHLYQAYRILGARNATQAVAICYEANLLRPKTAGCCRRYLASWLGQAAERVGGSP